MKERLRLLWQGQYPLNKIFWHLWPGLGLALTSLVAAAYSLYFLFDSFHKAGIGGIFPAFFTPLVFLQMALIFFLPAMALSAILLFVPLLRSIQRHETRRIHSIAALLIFTIFIFAVAGGLIYLNTGTG